MSELLEKQQAGMQGWEGKLTKNRCSSSVSSGLLFVCGGVYSAPEL